MEFVNAKARADVDAGRLLELNLGGGPLRAAGAYTVDIRRLPETDIVADLNEPLHLLPDNSVGRVLASHVLEHVENLDGLMREIQRVLAPGGTAHLVVPHFANPYGASDPT